MIGRAVVATDMHPTYHFFAPLTAEMWRSVVGYEPIVLCVGPGWNTRRGKMVLAALEDRNIESVLIPECEGHRNSTLAQVSRLYGWMAANPEEYVIVSDVDMWPLSRSWFRQHEAPADHMAVLYANNRTRFPICYVAGQAKTWREVLKSDAAAGDASDNDIIGRTHAHLRRHLSPTTAASDAWQHDEEWLTSRLHEWPGYQDRCLLVNRLAGEPPADRLDRAAWSPGNPGYVDAHLLRPGLSYWSQLRDLMAPTGLLSWADGYAAAYQQCND